MLKITIPASEQYNSETNTFFTTKEQHLSLEHSLLSISKWESKWKKPFLSKDDKTYEESIDYVRCMTITQNVDPLAYYSIKDAQLKQILDYIQDPMTATWFSEKKPPSREIITNEIIYYWMTALNIPFSCEKWHLNRLLTLIRVCSEKNQPPKKMKRGDILRSNQALNAARRKAHHTRG